MRLPISAWAVRNPVPVILLTLMLVFVGLTSFVKLPIKPLPDTSFPMVQVTVAQPGAAPREMISQIVRPVEGAITSLEGVRTVQTHVVPGGVIATAEFAVGDDPQRALDLVRGAMDGIRADLPGGIEEPVVERIEADDIAMVTYAVEVAGLSSVQQSTVVDEQLVRRLMGVRGVAQVVRVGGYTREINVLLDPARMSALGVTAGDVNQALNAAAVDATGGRSRIGGQEQAIRVLAAARSAADLANLDVNLGNGRTAKLGDIASITDGAAEQRGFAMLDGAPTIAIQIFKTKAASEVTVDKAIRAEVAAIEREQSAVKLTRLASTVEDTMASFYATEHMLLEGMVLAALVVAFFLRDWRATLIAAVAMPLSLIPTFWVMHLLGFSLNMVSLLALTLVIGILVDDAIVEIENITKRVAAGETPYNAALVAADDIGLAVVAVTFSIVAIFLPVSTLPGVIGRYFVEFGITISVAVLFSLLIARLVTPLMAAYFLSPNSHHVEQKALPDWYQQVLETSLAHPLKTFGIGILIFIASLGLATQLPTGFMPVGNKSVVLGTIEGPPGVTRAQMEEKVQAVTDRLMGDPAVARVFATVGAADASGELRAGMITILLKPREERKITARAWQARVAPDLQAIPDVRVAFLADYGESDVEVILTAEDETVLRAATQALVAQMRAVPGVTAVRTSAPPSNPDLVIRPIEAEAARLGVSAQAIGEAARIATVGEIDAQTPKLIDGELRIPIRVRLPEAAQNDLNTLAGLPVATSSGRSVPLGAVARLTFEPGTVRLDRFNRNPQIKISAALDGLALGVATERIEELPAYRDLPAGVTHAGYGDALYMDEMFGAFGAALLAGVLTMLAVLVLLFGSFWKPVTILMALPLSICGAFGALWLTGFAIDLPSIIGLLTLMGLVAKNSILLVEFAIEHERKGASPADAMLQACRQRARPIIMTTIAMVAGMIPTAIGIGEGSEFRQPMAVAVIGGLVASTLLSLIMVPAMHLLNDRLERFNNRVFGQIGAALGGASSRKAVTQH